MKKNAKIDVAAAPATLSDFLCFAVYSTNLAFGRVYKPLLDELGLTYLQFIVLIALHEQDGQTVGSLGGKLFLDSSTLTPLLKRLEAMGFLTRQRDALDERQVRVSLTDAGRRVRDRGTCGLGPIVDATGLAPDDFRRLQRDLVMLRNSLIKASS
jgi:MarR family transcriptional regulator, organic hydroperoxide resistance regulator